jgi:branched-chain amino acid aminotransferase
LTRAFVLGLAAQYGVPAEEGDLTLTDLYTADEAFTTGTMGALARVTEVDGRQLPVEAPLTAQLQAWYEKHILETAKPL